MKIIDTHIHYHRESVPGKTIIENMDASNVEKSIVLPTPDHPRYTLMGMTGNNAEVRKVCREFPDRLIPALYVEPRNIMEAQTAIRRFYDSGGRILKMWPGHGFSPDDPMIYPVWEVVNELKMIVIFHSGSLGSRPHLPQEVRRSTGFNAKFGQPFLLDQPGRYFSDIHFIIAHGGYPWTLEALEMAFMFENIYIDFSCELGLEAANLINRLQKESQRLLSAIEAAEERLKRLHAEWSREECYSDPQKSAAAAEAVRQTEDEIAKLTAEWEETESRLASAQTEPTEP